MSVETQTFDIFIADLAQQIANDRRYARENWQGIAVVIEIEPRQHVFGYIYREDGSWVPGMPDQGRTLDAANELSDLMTDRTGRAWNSCLIQITWPDYRVRTDFEYERLNRWVATPANLRRRVDELRPRT